MPAEPVVIQGEKAIWHRWTRVRVRVRVRSTWHRWIRGRGIGRGDTAMGYRRVTVRAWD